MNAKKRKYKTSKKQRVRSMKYNYEHREEIFEGRKKLRKPKRDKICELCHEGYKARNVNQKYCRDCAQEHALAYSREYNERKEKDKTNNRWQIFNRDNFTCQYCGKNPTEDGAKLHLDHIKPKIDGGTDDFGNLVTACIQCNLEKSTKSLRNEASFKERLRLIKK